MKYLLLLMVLGLIACSDDRPRLYYYTVKVIYTNGVTDTVKYTACGYGTKKPRFFLDYSTGVVKAAINESVLQILDSNVASYRELDINVVKLGELE